MIFAILILNRDEQYILEFLYRRETDSRLTYTEEGLYFLPLGVARDFANHQWEFCPVILKRAEIHRVLKPNDVLPFLEDDVVGEGGFGTVFKVKLKNDCQKLISANQEVVVARKELQDRQSNANERTILDLLQTLKHPNIVQFLGSYTQHGVQNLLFQYALMDLEQLFKSERIMDAHIIYHGMYGITNALTKIHDFTFKDGSVEFSKIGYHHDLRPANILVHGNIFLISDFGLSRLKADNQDSKSRLKGGNDDYLGPESFNATNWTNGVVGRALDVWSFGCILAETATFIERKSIADFKAKREATHDGEFIMTDNAFHLEGRIRPAVIDWLLALALLPSDQQVPGLVDLILQTLNPNSHKRIKMATVNQMLALLGIASKVHAINDKFQAVLSHENIQLSTLRVQVFLEHQKFKAWELTFNRLQQDHKLQNVDHLFSTFANFLDLLVSDMFISPSSDEVEQQVSGPMSKLWAANDSLLAYLSNEDRRRIQDLWTRTVCEVQDIGVLAAIRTAMALERYRLVGASAAMNYMSRLISSSIVVGRRSRYMDSGCVEIDDRWPTENYDIGPAPLIEDRSRTMGLSSGESGKRRVMIEWKEYDARWQGDPGEKIFDTMDALVNLLDPKVTPRHGVTNDRVLACLGYFHEPRNYRFGFLYSLDPLTPLNAGLFSINNIIRMTDPDEPDLVNTMRPNLGDIFHLAKDLSACLYAFHNAGWFHKTLSSHHLLVFSPSPEYVHKYVATAVLAGFNDSRPEASGYTLGPRQEFLHYQHPLYQTGVDFKKSFDYFGLGMILLELGLWRPASVLRSYHDEISSPEDFRVKLLNSYVPQLGERMGTLYRDAVEFCLDAERIVTCAQEDEGSFQDAQHFFESRVVELLSHCSA